MTSFPVHLARQRASVSGKLLTIPGAHVLRCVFNRRSKHQRDGEDKEENVANPQIGFPLEFHGWRFLGLGD